jgi:hypothetical protein
MEEAKNLVLAFSGGGGLIAPILPVNAKHPNREQRLISAYASP